jgi:DNA repair photolyase
MEERKSRPLSQYTKRIGLFDYCPRSIYSDLVAGCPAKKAGEPCVYCFNEFLEQKYGYARSFDRGFKLKDLKTWLTRKPGRLVAELKKVGVVRINANTDFYPELDQINADHIDIFTRSHIRVIAITKQYLDKIPLTISAIKRNRGILQVTFNFLDQEKLNDFEPYWTDIDAKKSGIVNAFAKLKSHLVLRISPIIIGVNDSDAEGILTWFKSIGGSRAIIHFLRKSSPELTQLTQKWNGIVPTKAGEFYTDEQMVPVLERLRKVGLELSICSEFELNKKYGSGAKSCCFI